MHKVLISIIFVIGILSIFSGCVEPVTKGDPPNYQTIRWKEDGEGFVKFFTNDPQYYGYSFYNGDDFDIISNTVFEVEVKKMSGFLDVGYGIVFSLVDKYNFYYLLIYDEQNYAIGKSVNNKYINITGTPEKPWISNSGLKKGYKTINKIRINKNIYTYTVTFNDNVTAYTFTDSSINGNDFGFMACIADQQYESLPVDVRGRVLQPVVYPNVTKSSHNYFFKNLEIIDFSNILNPRLK